MPEEYLDVSPDEPVWGHATANTTDGVRLHYVRRGRGTPVLFLHGWPGFWYQHFHNVPQAKAIISHPGVFPRADGARPRAARRRTFHAVRGTRGDGRRHSRPTVEAREVRCPRPASAPRIGSSQLTVRLRSIDNYPFSTTSDRSRVCGTPG
jgi:hypothetical protein